MSNDNQQRSTWCDTSDTDSVTSCGAVDEHTRHFSVKPSREDLVPIKLKDCGSTWSRTLYDVDGNVIKDKNGYTMNIFTSKMNDMFASGDLRLIHTFKEPAYRFFVTSELQLKTFRADREYGAPYSKVYHVYLDDDADKECYAYHKLFITPITDGDNRKHKRSLTGKKNSR